MQLTTFSSASDFLSQTRVQLEQNEAAHNLMLGICTRLVQHPKRVVRRPYLATVRDHVGDVLAAAVMTPPFGLVVYGRNDGVTYSALDLVIADLLANDWPVSGVNGQPYAANAFLHLWEARTHVRVKATTHERIYQLKRVIAPRWPSGWLRVADEEEASLIAEWIGAFQEEAMPHNPHPDRHEWASDAIADGDLFVWDDCDQPLSMAKRGRSTTNGVSIGAVFTPPHVRGRGYASAVVRRILVSVYPPDIAC